MSISYAVFCLKTKMHHPACPVVPFRGGSLCKDSSAPEISTLSLHDALPIFELQGLEPAAIETRLTELLKDLNIAHLRKHTAISLSGGERRRLEIARALGTKRSEEHTSELQSHVNLVCRLLPENKNAPPRVPRRPVPRGQFV